jgi:hypothetical protein
MAQIFPNFVTVNARGSAPAPIQTEQVAAAGTGSQQFVALTWDSPYNDFPVVDYDVVISVEATTGDGSSISVGGFTKSATGVSVSLTANLSQGVKVHAVGFSAGPGNS